MVLKRPKNIAAQESEEESDVELMEHLVKKSLDINPNLRDGRDTQEILKGLRSEAVSKSTAGKASSGADASSEVAAPSAAEKQAKLAARRRSTIEFFFEQKAEEFEAASQEVNVRRRALEQELKKLQADALDEVVDFLSLLAGGAESPEARDVMKAYRKFLKELGVSDTEIVQAAKRRA